MTHTPLSNLPISNARRLARACGAVLALAAFGHAAGAAPSLPGQAAIVAAGAGDAPASAYVLSPDDQLQISVLGHADLASTVTVLPDGTFDYPILHRVHAAGLTVDGLTRTLEDGLSGQIAQPQVTVSVSQSRPRKVSVLGAVRVPGLYDVRPGTHLLDILAACGGPAQEAVLTQITLVTDGGRKSLPVDCVALLGGADTSQNLPLLPGDVLLVQTRDPAVAQVQVLGEVGRPGAFSVPAGGATVSTLLTEAGSVTPRAALSRVQVMHGGRVRVVDLRPAQSSLADPAGAARLVAGDVLLVPANTARVALLGDFRAPATYEYPDGGQMTALSALTLAGGPAPDADSKKASIVRRDAAGAPTVIPVNLDALLKGDPKTADVPLLPNDVLYLPIRGTHQTPLQALSQLGALGYLLPFVHL